MSTIDRRQFARLAGGAGAAVATSIGRVNFAIAEGASRVVVIGGGAGGATTAHLLKTGEPKLDVTLIEASPAYSTSFFSNLYIGGFRTFASLNHDYVALKALGIRHVTDYATAVDTTKKVVGTRSGRTFGYDRLVLSPGIDMKFDSVPGYSKDAATTIPHAYTTDGSQKLLLKKQLDAMKDGGTVVMVMPGNPYRCPPAPYERACMIAHLIKTRKPRSKLVILDPKRNFSKQSLFTEAFEDLYKGIIELNLTNEIDDFGVEKLDPKSRTVTVKAGQDFRADVLNVIPQQKAGDIAAKAGLAQGDWCPVDPATFLAKAASDVYVIGDAAFANDIPKSASAATSEAKLIASDILATLTGKERQPARLRNICWSILGPDDSVKLGANYLPKDAKLEQEASAGMPGSSRTCSPRSYRARRQRTGANCGRAQPRTSCSCPQ